MRRMRTIILLSLSVLFFFSCQRQKQSGELSPAELKKIFSSGVYFLTSKYEIKDEASLAAAIDKLYADEGAIPITATRIKRIGDYDEAKKCYVAEMDVQSEAHSGIALNTWRLTLEKGADDSKAEYYALFLFAGNQDRRLVIYKSALPGYLAKADGISLHFDKARSLIN